MAGLAEHVGLAAYQARLYQDLSNSYQELQQTQRAVIKQERLRSLGQMAAGIVHDINNAVSPVVGFPDLLLDSEPNLSERTRKYLEYIRTAGADVAHIISQMRQFYRQREEQEKLSPVDLRELIQQVLAMTSARWSAIPQEKGITIDMKTFCEDGLPPVMGVASEIREVLTNLIGNAVDAMPHSGTIIVSARSWRPPGLAHQQGGILLEVTDTGTGMDEATKERCLEPFFTTKGEGGTGLGLAMVYSVIQLHQGNVEIESEQAEPHHAAGSA